MMDVTMKTSVLAEELAVMDRVVPRRPVVPALAYVKMTAEPNAVQLVGTDLRVGIRSVTTDAVVREAGSTLVPTVKLSELVRALPETDLRLQVAGDTVTLSADGYRGTLKTYPMDDYPATPEPETGSASLPCDPAMLRGLITRTRFAISSHEDARGAINGALLEWRDGAVNMVATDGHRLAIATRAMDTSAGGAMCVLPPRMVDALVPMLDGWAESVPFNSTDRHAFVTVGDRLVFAQLIEGTFPGYRRMVPVLTSEIAVARAPLAAALRRARIVSEAARVDLQFEANTLTVLASAVAVGSGDDRLVIAYDGPVVSVALNGAYLADFIDAIASETVAVQLPSAAGGIVFRATDGDLACVYVVMPMRG